MSVIMVHWVKPGASFNGSKVSQGFWALSGGDTVWAAKSGSGCQNRGEAVCRALLALQNKDITLLFKGKNGQVFGDGAIWDNRRPESIKG